VTPTGKEYGEKKSGEVNSTTVDVLQEILTLVQFNFETDVRYPREPQAENQCS
jgi:hypothetical protein